MTPWLILALTGLLIASLMLLKRTVWANALICELPGLTWILLAGKPQRGEARRILESRARHSEPEQTLRALAARQEQLVAERDALVQVSEFAAPARQMPGAMLCDLHGAHVYAYGEPCCVICDLDPEP